MATAKIPLGPLFRERRFKELREILRSDPTQFDGPIKGLLFNSAIVGADCDAMQFILDAGYDINEVTITGTPLKQAASHGRMDVIRWLLDHGAKVDDSALSTNPLFGAISGGHPEAVTFFLSLGVDPNKRYPCGRNALDFARVWNKPAVVSALGGDSDWKHPPWVRCSIPDLTGQRPSYEMLEAVEKELRRSVPVALVRFLLAKLPASLFHPEAKDNDDWEWLGPDHKMFHTARSLIAYNCLDPQLIRKKPRYKKYFVIGTDGSGNDWCVRDAENDERVWSHDHETGGFQLEHQSIQEFAEALLGRTANAP